LSDLNRWPPDQESDALPLYQSTYHFSQKWFWITDYSTAAEHLPFNWTTIVQI
jgi:hypothetical protein